MDSYDEASSNFEKAYAEDSGYEMAISIYEAYLNQDMEADGTRYLEAVLASGPKNAEDHCARGRIYYYMQDYENAHSELSDAMEQGSTEAKLLTGMVYLAQEDTENARAMYQDYLDSEDCVPAKGYNGSCSAIWRTETMTAPLAILPPDLRTLPVKICRISFSTKLRFMRDSWILPRL